MQFDFAGEKPLFLQVADEIEDAIFTGAFPEETQVPSTTEISVTYKINPATVLKGMNRLVESGFLYKKRGVGMFVQSGAVGEIRKKRQTEFSKNYVEKLIEEAKKLGLTKTELIELIERGM